MKPSLYVFFVLVVVSNLFNLRFLPTIAYDSNESFVLLMGVIALGFIYFRRKNIMLRTLLVQKYIQYFELVWITIGISIVTCLLFWGQSPIQSILTYRRFFSYLFLFTLLWISPSIEEIIKGFKYYTYTFLVIAFCIWVLHIPMTNIVYDADAEISMNNSIPGTTIVLFYFYYLLMKLRERFSFKDLILVSCLMIYYVINQNRSLMFPCLLFYIYTLVYKVKINFFLKSIIIISLSCILFYNFELIENLLNETRGQVDDDSYVRWTAIDYFLTDLSPNFICHVFGNGIISSVSNPAFWLKLYSNMWNFNDVGWFGYYAFFGLLGTMAIFNIILRILFDRRSSSDVQMFLIHMLVPTIWCLWMPDTIVLFCLVVYIYLYRRLYAL